MSNRRLTFLSFVAILSSVRLSSREPLSPTSVSALSPGGRSGNHFKYNSLCSYVPDHHSIANGGTISGFTTTVSRMSTSSLNMATSSSDLKNVIENTKSLTATEVEIVSKEEIKDEEDSEELGKKRERKFEGISNNVVSRLARAAKEAAMAKRKKTTKEASNESKKARRRIEAYHLSVDSSFDDDSYMFEEDEDIHENQNDLSSISKLNSVIDQELLRPNDGYKPARETDSIRLLLEHNNDQDQNQNNILPAFNKSIISPSSATLSSSKLQKNGKSSNTNLTPKDVAIVFGRPLCEDQITIEYAFRLVSLAKAMKFEEYKPSLICFCGPASSMPASTTANTTATKHRSAPSIGIDFFEHLCSTNDISLEGTDLCRVPTFSSTSPSSFSSSWSIFSLNPVVKKLLEKHYLEKWQGESEAYESDMDEYGMTRQEPRKKIHIHWKLFSTEYHLCNLNDIHIRSPRQSPLARLMHDLEHAVNSEDYQRGIVQTTWSFHYSIYPYVVSSDKPKMKEAFLGKCYLMAQSLVPLLVNLKGVAENVSSFQLFV